MSAMQFSKQAAGYQSWFTLSFSTGGLAAGIPSGSFTVTIVDPSDSVSSALTVTESTNKPGMYFFYVPSAFITTNGVGEYGVVVEVNHDVLPLRFKDSFGSTLRISESDFDDLAKPGDCSGGGAAHFDTYLVNIRFYLGRTESAFGSYVYPGELLLYDGYTVERVLTGNNWTSVQLDGAIERQWITLVP